MRDQLITMLDLQNKMNTKVHSDWVAQNYEWYRAIWLECAELVDHHGYKWWKHQQPDMKQVQLEVVDIWHFGLSMCFDGSSIETIADRIIEALEQHQAKKMTILDATEALAEVTLATRQFSVSAFWQLLQSVDMDFNQLFVAYVGKNVLNFFRQDHGYKDGSYQKIWQGREDNEHLFEIQSALDSSLSDFADQLYAQLSERYQALT